MADMAARRASLCFRAISLVFTIYLLLSARDGEYYKFDYHYSCLHLEATGTTLEPVRAFIILLPNSSAVSNENEQGVYELPSSPRCVRNILIPTKEARLILVYKKNYEAHTNNYRPISLLSVPSKIMKSCVPELVVRHVSQNKLVTDKQWAYRYGHSTELLLVHLSAERSGEQLNT